MIGTAPSAIVSDVRLVPDSSRVFLDDVENDAFAAAVRPVAD